MYYRQLRQAVDKATVPYQCKFDIVDNLDKLSTSERKKILYLFEKKFWEFEKWFLLRSLIKITKSQDRAGEW